MPATSTALTSSAPFAKVGSRVANGSRESSTGSAWSPYAVRSARRRLRAIHTLTSGGLRRWNLCAREVSHRSRTRHSTNELGLMSTLQPAVAYFSMEIGLQADIPTYSGGLGMLAGDMIRAVDDRRRDHVRNSGVAHLPGHLRPLAQTSSAKTSGSVLIFLQLLT